MHKKFHSPRRGSLAYLPRGRARSINGRMRNWPEVVSEKATLLGFAGYKAGMTHIFAIEGDPKSPSYGRETFHAVTLIETPPIQIVGLRAYSKKDEGLRCVGEAWLKDTPRQLRRILTVPEHFDTDEEFRKLSEMAESIHEVRALAITEPQRTSMAKNSPDLLEIGIGGGSVRDRLQFARGLLGKRVPISSVFKEGGYVDVVSVSRGLGIQGPVKRWGIRRKLHKAHKHVREVGSIGPWNPSRVMYTVPRAGQMGLGQRTEYNKRILKIGENGPEVTPRGGFTRYGPIKGQYIMLKGSVPGPEKRLVRLRLPIRGAIARGEAPRITQISLRSIQG